PPNLVPSVPIQSQTGGPTEIKVRSQEIDAASARSLARIAFWDIMVFFGVLLVGFAFLWKRGDLVWVRSTAAEGRPSKPPAEAALAIPSEGRELVGAGT